MATKALGNILQHLRRSVLRRDGAGLLDGELLELFITQQDEAAFEALMRRHGPMVFGVCRRILQNETDAEDAFQATFLVLVRKANSIRPRGMVGNWLYGVAHGTALKARAMNKRRRVKERDARARPKLGAPTEIRQHLQTVLDQELAALSDKYRTPIVLCDLEGKSIKEAARQLGCPQGTVSSWLTRGRILLARRLVRHGLPFSGGLIAAVLSQSAAAASVPSALLASTLKAVTYTVKAATWAAAGKVPTTIVSAKVAALTQGAIQTMFLNKLKVATATLLIAGALFAGMTIMMSGPAPAALAAGGARGVKKDTPPDEAPPPSGVQERAGGEGVVKVGNYVASLAYCNGGKTLAVLLWDGPATSQTGSFVLWNVEKGKIEKTLETFDRDKDKGKDSPRYLHVVSSKDGTTIAASFTSWKKVAFGAIKVWEAKTGKLLQTFTADQQLLGAIALSPDGKKLIGGTERAPNCKLFVWDVPSGTLDKTLEAEDMQYCSAAISDDGKWVVAGCLADNDNANAKVIVWELETGNVKHEWTDNSNSPTSNVSAVALSPDGQMVAAGGVGNPMVRMWDMQTGKQKHLLEAPKDYPFVCGLAFSPDGRSLAIAGKISVKLWDVAKEKELAMFQEPEGRGPGRVAFAADGRTLAISGGAAGTIQFLQIGSRRLREP